MGTQAYHLCGGAGLKKKYKIAVTIADPGIPILIGAAANNAAVIPTAATTAGPFIGLGLDTATYSATQGDAEGIVSVDIRPDLVTRMTISGGAAEGTALTLITEETGEAAGLVLTSGDVGTTDMDGGMLFRVNTGESRSITAFSSGASLTVVVPFTADIAVGDTFIAVPFNTVGDGAASGGDGMGDATLTTLFTQVRGDIAVGDGVDIVVTDVVVKSTTQAFLYFTLRDHALNVDTI